MPCTSETRPMKLDGPTFRHRNVATTEESSICAGTGAARATAAAPATTVSTRNRCMTSHWVGWRDEAATIRHYSYERLWGSVEGGGWRVEGRTAPSALNGIGWWHLRRPTARL